MKKLIVGIIIPFLVINLFGTAVFAHSGQVEIDQSQIDFALVRLSPIRFLPGHPFYSLILVKEKVQHIFKPNQLKKADFDLLLASKRIKEAYLLNQERKYDKAEKQIENYAKALDKFLTASKKAKEINMNARDLNLKAVESLSYQQPIILDLEDYPKAQEAHKKFEEVVEYLKEQSGEIADLIKTRIPQN